MVQQLHPRFGRVMEAEQRISELFRSPPRYRAVLGSSAYVARFSSGDRLRDASSDKRPPRPSFATIAYAPSCTKKSERLLTRELARQHPWHPLVAPGRRQLGFADGGGATLSNEDGELPDNRKRGRRVEIIVATCDIALSLGRRPVCIIDEPEMCLHPPQALRLGRFIGSHASSMDRVTFVATHSSQVLRGVIQTGENIQIVRLRRSGKHFSAHLVPAQVLKEAVERPTVRAESVLDGIFAHSVIVVEGDGDRLVYQTTWETLSPEVGLDCHFAAVGGIGGIADTCGLYRTLKIPVAVVADLDAISDPQKLRSILEKMAPSETASALTERARVVMDALAKLPPGIDLLTVKSRLVELSGWHC